MSKPFPLRGQLCYVDVDPSTGNPHSPSGVVILGTNNGIARDDTEKHGVTKLCEL